MQSKLVTYCHLHNATPEREAMVATLRGIYGYENIHIFGSQRGKCVDKLEILSRSVVNLCFENSLGDGYVTENFAFKNDGVQSLYWGDTSYSKDFSSQDIHNVKTSRSLEETLLWCEEAITNPQKYKM